MKKDEKIKTITLVGRSKLALLKGGMGGVNVSDLKEDLTVCACCNCKSSAKSALKA